MTAELTSYSGALTDSADLAAVTRTAPARTLSGWFRGRQEEQDRLIATVSRQTQEALESVRIVSNGAITVSGSSGTIPVTVENLGPAPVTVGLTLTGNPARLFTAEPVEPFRIEPGRRTSVEVPAEVNAAGPIPVTIEATTVKGAPFGVPGRLTVSSSAYANAARLLVQASLALLLITVIVHGVRRARRRSGTRPANQPAPLVPERARRVGIRRPGPGCRGPPWLSRRDRTPTSLSRTKVRTSCGSRSPPGSTAPSPPRPTTGPRPSTRIRASRARPRMWPPRRRPRRSAS